MKNYFIFFVFVLMLLSPVMGHESDGNPNDGHDENDPLDAPATNSGVYRDVSGLKTVSPMSYFSEGKIINGIFLLVLWLLVIWGLYTLVLMIIGRTIISKERGKKKR